MVVRYSDGNQINIAVATDVIYNDVPGEETLTIYTHRVKILVEAVGDRANLYSFVEQFYDKGKVDLRLYKTIKYTISHF